MIKITRKGSIPIKYDYEGKCLKCGCEILAHKDDLSSDMPDVTVFIKCPTAECNGKIIPRTIP